MRHPAILCSIILMLICVIDGVTQRRSSFQIRKPSPEFYLGAEVLRTTHAVTFRSDIPELSDLRVRLGGLMLGGVAGNRIVRVRVRRGELLSGDANPEKIRATTAGGAVTFFPLQVVSRRLRMWEPYAIVGVSRMKYDFFGNYVSLKPVSMPPPPNPDCVCTCCGAVLPADPDAVAGEPVSVPPPPTESLPEGTHLGDIATRNLNAGFGIETHIQVRHLFVHFFVEGNYLVAGRISENNVAFAKTSVTAPLEIRFGVSAGLGK